MVHNTDPWRAITRAEIDLLLAEIELKGLGSTGLSADAHVRNAVVNSINYWYFANSHAAWDKITDVSRSFMMPAAPSEAVKQQYADIIAGKFNSATSLDDKMHVIMEQKYVHFNIHDYFESFSELRRTRLPKLGKMKWSATLALEPHVERWPYPGNESSTNFDALKDYANENNYTTPIFWVPASKRSEGFYDPGYRDEYLYIRYPGVPETFKP